jgi:hypothetical protein
LTLSQKVFRGRERIACVEALIPEKAVEVSTPVVRARARQNVDDATRSAAKFRDATRCHNLKLIDDLFAVLSAGQIRCVVISGNTVDDEAVVKIALSGYRETLARNG